MRRLAQMTIGIGERCSACLRKRARTIGAAGLFTAVLIVLDGTLGISFFFSNLQHFAGRGALNTLAYFVMLSFLSATSLLLLKARSRLFGALVLAIFIVSTALELGFKIVHAEGFAGHWVERAIVEMNLAPTVLRSYFTKHALVAIIASVAVWTSCFALLRRSDLCGPNLRWRPIAALLTGITVVSVASYLRFGDLELHPITLRPAANVVNHYVQPWFRAPREEPPVQLLADQVLVASKVILVVDESVAGPYLSLNGYPVDTTPYLQSISDRLLNFGIASSGATCSYGANIFLNSYVRLEDVSDRRAIEKRQTIYYYAKKAGFRTAMLSGQTRSPLFNGIIKGDLAYIDEVILAYDINRGPSYLNDGILVDELRKLFERHPGERIFALVQKLGSHVTYDDYYPEDGRPFSPVLAGKPIGRENVMEVLNSYYNGLRHAVDGFYRKLDRAIEGLDVVLIYTSDHGQNFDFATSMATHCGVERSMAAVPLWIDVRGPATLTRLHQRFGSGFDNRNRDHASHFNLFPTLLSLMNVASDRPTLFDDLSHQTRYYSHNKTPYTYRRLAFDVAGTEPTGVEGGASRSR